MVTWVTFSISLSSLSQKRESYINHDLRESYLTTQTARLIDHLAVLIITQSVRRCEERVMQSSECSVREVTSWAVSLFSRNLPHGHFASFTFV